MLLANENEISENEDRNTNINGITISGENDGENEDNSSESENTEDMLWIKQVSRLENYEERTISTAFSSFLDQNKQLHTSSKLCSCSHPSIFGNNRFERRKDKEEKEMKKIKEMKEEKEMKEMRTEEEDDYDDYDDYDEIIYTLREVEALQNGEGVIKPNLQKSTQREGNKPVGQEKDVFTMKENK